MLELRPSCENCNKALPPESVEARICSFECTFCEACVTGVLSNVCPNCGGGFERRPIRPAKAWRNDTSLAKFPAGTKVRHKPVDAQTQAQLIAAIGGLPPEKR